MRVRRIAETDLQIDTAIVAEVRAKRAGVGIKRNQFRIDGVHQNTALAKRAFGNHRRRDRR